MSKTIMNIYSWKRRLWCVLSDICAKIKFSRGEDYFLDLMYPDDMEVSFQEE